MFPWTNIAPRKSEQECTWHRGMSVLRDWVIDLYEFSKSWITVKKLARRNMFFLVFLFFFLSWVCWVVGFWPVSVFTRCGCLKKYRDFPRNFKSCTKNCSNYCPLTLLSQKTLIFYKNFWRSRQGRIQNFGFSLPISRYNIIWIYAPFSSYSLDCLLKRKEHWFIPSKNVWGALVDH